MGSTRLSPPASAIRATIGWWLTRRRSMPRHRHRCASSASAAKAQQPMKSSPVTSTMSGPGAVTPAAASVTN
ncbi:Uncharacterised protein [Mycobacterium tuberculosis]|nr:Uncharacterised protein [Mycobacterium tuberculosis]